MTNFVGYRHAVTTFAITSTFINAFFDTNMSRADVCVCVSVRRKFIIRYDFITEIIKQFR